jgi:hypothetical protein
MSRSRRKTEPCPCRQDRTGEEAAGDTPVRSLVGRRGSLGVKRQTRVAVQKCDVDPIAVSPVGHQHLDLMSWWTSNAGAIYYPDSPSLKYGRKAASGSLLGDCTRASGSIERSGPREDGEFIERHCRPRRCLSPCSFCCCSHPPRTKRRVSEIKRCSDELVLD